MLLLLLVLLYHLCLLLLEISLGRLLLVNSLLIKQLLLVALLLLLQLETMRLRRCLLAIGWYRRPKAIIIPGVASIRGSLLLRGRSIPDLLLFVVGSRPEVLVGSIVARYYFVERGLVVLVDGVGVD